MRFNKYPFGRQWLIIIIESAREHYKEISEVIPSYTEVELSKLLCTLDRIYSGCYARAEEKISAVIFNVTKGHFLSNGNKRMAAILAAHFLGFEGLISSYSEIAIKKLGQLVMEVTCDRISKEELLQIIPRGYSSFISYEKEE